MEAKLFIQYYAYDDDDKFDASSDYYKDGEYAKLMNSEYEKSKDAVFESMSSGGKVTKPSAGSYWEQYGISEPSQNDDKNIRYSSTNCILYNENGDEESVDGIIDHYVDQKPFIEMVEIDCDSSEDEFISEFSMWLKEHKKISEFMEKNRVGDDVVWKYEPKRDLKLSFINKANEEVYATLSDCRVMDIIDDKTLIVFIGKLTLVDKI